MNQGAQIQPTGVLRSLSLTVIGLLAGLSICALGLTYHLWPHWGTNADLSHGYFVPVLFVFLLAESRRGTPRVTGTGKRASCVLIIFLLLSVAAVAVAGLYAAVVYWSHAAVSLMLSVSLGLLIIATGLVLARSDIGLAHFNWPLVVAAGIWLLATPIPPGTYTRLTLSLQLWVSEAVLNTLHLLGIAAVRRGNIIDLVHATVGVEDACSGIRSLISCIFAALFFSATLVHRPWARVLIIGLAPPLALVMNFIRSLALTLMAGAKIEIAGFWHDVTGFAVLGVTAVTLGSLALVLNRAPARKTAVPQLSSRDKYPNGPFYILGAGMLSAFATLAFFLWHTRPVIASDSAPPDLSALMPEPPSGWVARTPNLFAFSGTLQTNHLAQRDYLQPLPGGEARELVIYAAYWRAGQAPVSLVASHTPDACWPGVGWEAVSIRETTVALSVAGRTLPAAEQRIFRSSGRPYHVWFWHLHGGKPLVFRDPYSSLELLRYALRYGFRRDADQLFVRISSNQPWSEIQQSPVLRDFLQRTVKLGL